MGSLLPSLENYKMERKLLKVLLRVMKRNRYKKVNSSLRKRRIRRRRKRKRRIKYKQMEIKLNNK
jgi:hypothetical protein